MREITDHKIAGLNESIRISVIDEPGSGGASHNYEIDLKGSPTLIKFQDGPISKKDDENGITQESLLAVVIDRLRSFQSGPYSCRENALALTYCEQALMWLQKRTLDRIKRGVEGTLNK